MIACLGIYRPTALVCGRCAWYDSCPADLTERARCSGPWDFTDTTQGEFKAAESEEVEEAKVVPAELPYPAQHRIIRDSRKYVLITAPRRLQRGRNQ